MEGEEALFFPLTGGVEFVFAHLVVCGDSLPATDDSDCKMKQRRLADAFGGFPSFQSTNLFLRAKKADQWSGHEADLERRLTCRVIGRPEDRFALQPASHTRNAMSTPLRPSLFIPPFALELELATHPPIL